MERRSMENAPAMSDQEKFATAYGRFVTFRTSIKSRYSFPLDSESLADDVAIRLSTIIFDLLEKARADERERCAKIAIEEKVSGETGTDGDIGYNQACEDIAEAIRAQEGGKT